jgi:hypothetical protein
MENPLSEKGFWRLAGAIRDRLCAGQTNRYREVQTQVQHLMADLAELDAVRRKLGLCLARGWTAAASNLAEEALRLFRNLHYTGQEATKVVEKPETPVPTVREVLEELLQAEEEFEGLQYNPEDEILSVTTDAVELEGVYLGDFEVQLLIPAIGDSNHRSLYQIVALDPHPSLRNDSVTHPHVNDQRLCAGDAGAAIEMALAGGRICDFFMLVRSVLTTYNRDSAYVTLEDWEGSSCYDCGSVVREDDSYYCTSCENEFCGECSSYCHRCEETTCQGCLAPCPVCEESTCNSCLTTCPECGRILCRDCHEEEKCPCLEEEPENEEENNDNNSSRSEGGEATGEDGEVRIVSDASGASQTGTPVETETSEERDPETRAPVLADRLGQAPILP